ncbi:MAG: MFS transporter [Candidatus Omnitrophota bacterium]
MTMSSDYKKKAFQLIIFFGLISLFGDIVYEGARSVNGPYLKTLGVSAAVVGFIAGLGEFIGYAIRMVSGYFADKTKAYWVFTFLGYGMLVSVPLLSLTGVWQVAALFIIMERLGKALRAPARDTIVSQASKQIGTGLGFAISEVMDQIGALTGPLILSGLFLVVGASGNEIAKYQRGYSLFWIPFILVMACVTFAFIKVPNPEKLEMVIKKAPEPDKLSKTFCFYTVFSFITTMGFVNFALIGYHFKAKNVLTDAQIPLFYAVAMAVDGVAAWFIGTHYDRLKKRSNNEKAGLGALLMIPLFSVFIPVFAFSMNFTFALISAVIWGVVMGIHETIMKSAIADLTPMKKRGTGYGLFNAAYGLAMFIGSALMGVLYDYSIAALIGFAVFLQILAIPVFFMMKREILRQVV